MDNKKEIIKSIKSNIAKVTNQKGFDRRGKPFFKKGNDTGILFIHGFDNTAHIMQEYTDYFAHKGFTVYNITLPGRGLSVQELGASCWKKWVNYALNEYMLFKSLVKKIFIAGFSTGATIALHLTQNLKSKDSPDGLILSSPALFFVTKLLPLPVQYALFKIYATINPFPKKLNNRHKIIIDPAARSKYDYLERSSSNAVLELFKLAHETRKNVNKIKKPVLIIQSKKDIVIEKHGADWLFKNIGSDYKKILWLKKSGHPVMIDLEKDLVFKETENFINLINSQ
jgi:carboxylesterase